MDTTRNDATVLVVEELEALLHGIEQLVDERVAAALHEHEARGDHVEADSRNEIQAGMAARFMCLSEYARHARVSERTVRYDLKDMEEGRHYHRAGKKKGRVIVHVAEADAWRTTRTTKSEAARSVEALAIDEVTQRRARAALRRCRGEK